MLVRPGTTISMKIAKDILTWQSYQCRWTPRSFLASQLHPYILNFTFIMADAWARNARHINAFRILIVHLPGHHGSPSYVLCYHFTFIIWIRRRGFEPTYPPGPEGLPLIGNIPDRTCIPVCIIPIFIPFNSAWKKPRLTASLSLDIAYGIDVQSHDDPLRITVGKSSEAVIVATNPGAFLVDSLPICKFNPINVWKMENWIQKFAIRRQPSALAEGIANF